MEEIFRFMVVRAPDADLEGVRIKLSEPAVVSEMPAQGDKVTYESAIAALATFLEDDRFITLPSEVYKAEELSEIRRRMLSSDPEYFDLDDVLAETLGDNPETVTSTIEWREGIAALNDSVLAHKLVNLGVRRPLKELADLYRMMRAIEAIGSGEISNNAEAAVAYLGAPLVLPPVFSREPYTSAMAAPGGTEDSADLNTATETDGFIPKRSRPRVAFIGSTPIVVRGGYTTRSGRPSPDTAGPE